ncbi:hypothetical protein JOC70_000582 [Clostridium pascui]|nr:hypothetical protein [Clostridium pascui]
MSRHRLLDLSKFQDCSGLSENGKCTRITVSDCQGEKCSFKRTLKEDLDSIQWAISVYLTLTAQHKNISPKNIMAVPCRGTEKSLFNHIVNIRG